MDENHPSLALEIAGQSISARLELAIKRGDVIRHEDGSLSLAVRKRNENYIRKHGKYHPPCRFLNALLFQQIYEETTVPFGCRECYKIKISSRTLRQLIAVKEIAEASGHTTKSGAEVDSRFNQDLYGTYLYFHGLDEARKLFKTIRQSIDQHQNLGQKVEMRIKRGCSNYERKCGPSDQYKFDPRLELAESYLLSRFASNKVNGETQEEQYAMWLLRMIATAYRIGDDTYKDLTGGKPAMAPSVSYSPTEELGAPTS